MTDGLSSKDIEQRLPAGWTGGTESIQATYAAASFTEGGELVGVIAALADEQNHHPDLALSFPGHVKVTLTSHDSGGVTERDLAQAQRIAELATQAEAQIAD